MFINLKNYQSIYLRYFLTRFKVDQFNSKDYKTICSLLRQKYPIYNQQITIFNDIRLLDQNNKLIGIYSPHQARKKAYSIQKDIILINKDNKPAICKAIDFRNNILNKFFQEIISKRNQQLISKALQIRNVKIKVTSNQFQLKIKAKQIIQLSKKNSKVRVYLTCKESVLNDGYTKMDFVKSELQNNCKIINDISQNKRQDSINSFQEIQQSENTISTKTLSMVVKSINNQFVSLLEQSSKQAPQKAIFNFLKRFYKQQDTDMRDLREEIQKKKKLDKGITDEFINPNQAPHLVKVQQRKTNKESGIQKKNYKSTLTKQLGEIQIQRIQKKAKQQILIERLKSILAIYQKQ